MENWKINCMERKYPGLWHTWFREQIVAVGWPPSHFSLHADSSSRAWQNARSSLKRIELGDRVVVQLDHWRVGRIGTVIEKRIEDDEWHPSVPAKRGDQGEMGRRIHVRWDLTTGPLTATSVVQLPREARPNPQIWRGTLRRVPDNVFNRIVLALRDQNNWGSLVRGFASERALSEYISASPHLLEDGLVPFPSKKAREMVFADGTRLDVLLLDKDSNIVIVECKQGNPSTKDLDQIRRYMRNAKQLRVGALTGKKIRGFLVHGGARKLRDDVRQASQKGTRIQMMQHSVSVGFAPSV